MSKIFSAKWTTSCRKIEIDINYLCHLKCPACNRSCTQAPSPERISLQQIEKFIQESIDNKRRWEVIRVVGGEPALHPDFSQILDRLREYKLRNSPDTKLTVVTNGSGPAVGEALKKVPVEYKIENTRKENKGYEHISFNDAPRDDVAHLFFDYSAGCEIRSCCGMGMTPYGYYCCAIAGGIDRIVGLDLGRKALPPEGDDLSDQTLRLCAYCGHFIWGRVPSKALNSRGIFFNIFSRSWRSAYGQYRKQTPKLLPY
ncbi:MAG: radical SAM protein [Candidatus Omnitrophica bacterium]|nr:radical SAM protein [Candidatus Omnitrophota bacterium]